MLLFDNAGVLAGTGGEVTGAWRRLVAHFLRSVATPEAPLPPMPPPPDSDALLRVMLQNAGFPAESTGGDAQPGSG